jgi:hypothetical protein
MKPIAGLALLAALSQDQNQPPPMPKHEKAHEWLKSMEGEWDLATKFTFEPGKPPVEGKARETARMAVGGFFLVFDVKGEMPMPFEGHGVMGYDTFKKKVTV